MDSQILSSEKSVVETDKAQKQDIKTTYWSEVKDYVLNFMIFTILGITLM